MISKYVNILIYRSAAELRSEGTRTYIGYLWWILEPLMSLAVYYVAFKYFLLRDTEHFALFLFIGIIIYRFFSGTIIRSAGSIINNQGLMQLVYLHKSIFPLTVVLVNLAKFLITFLLAVLVCWLCGMAPSWAYLAIPVLIGLELLITAGLALLCAAITPFFPDFQLVLATLMHLLIFLSGVFYDIKELPPGMQRILQLNPVAVTIEQFRAVLMYGTWPRLQSIALVTAESVLVLALGWFLTHKYNRYFPKVS